jgi:hypothetical protein
MCRVRLVGLAQESRQESACPVAALDDEGRLWVQAV